MPRWTTEQQQAIDLEGTNILVSAGAGSGKTAVLSERALRKVKEGTNIDEILILTFTKAAAYEMMLRIRDKIQKNGFADQVNRIDKAYITTFDSFALSIIKKYHDRLNLKKDVSIIDENAISLIKKETLDTIFDEYYESGNQLFLKLITDFSLRDDKEIKQYILNINDKLDLKYNKNDYLNDYLNEFYNLENINNKKNEYEELLKKNIETIKSLLKDLEISLDGDEYNNYLETLLPLINSKTYDEIKNNINIKLPRLTKNSGEEAKRIKDDIKKYLDDLSDMCIFENSVQMIDEYFSTKDYIEIIIEIIKELDKRVITYKYKNNSFEFIDISKLAIDLVMKYPDIKEELKNYFNEIMIDEYQDTSDLQEQFIQLIENNNTYMVGDIKQSIYRFRNANPFIFKQKYENYSKELNGKKIDLNKNFRSRKEVLENINLLFDTFMDDNFGGANYQESHRMVFGNETYINEGKTEQDYDINIYNYHIDKDSEYKKYTKDEIEAFIIANDIKKKITEKYQVFDKDTCVLRDIRYSDFVILMDRSSKFTLYKKIFEYMKIPLTILRDENIMDQNEVYLIRNLLKLIECLEEKKYENSFRYSFVSIARSYLFSYQDQTVFHIINNNLYFEDEIINKANKIVNSIHKMSLKEIISKIIDEFEISEKIINFGNIEMGIAVLEYFLNLADNLQNLGYDYHRFIEYLDYIIENGKEIKIPVSINDDDSCQIMTIHKSKGLEYPICYYSGLSSSFNISDLKEKIIYDNDYGIITPCFINGYQDTFYKLLLRNKYIKEEISEKIRLFYVALTRCKEKMIIISNLEEQETNMINGIVSTSKREQYRSFLDILKSIYEIVEDYIKNINLDEIVISNKYKIIDSNKTIENQESNQLEVIEYKQKENDIVIESAHFSKTVNTLIDKEIKKNMQFGTRIHEILETIDFKNPELDKFNITEFEKKSINSFLNQPLLKNIKQAKFLKEYEFYIIEDTIEKHGIIDLILEYDDHVDIIDYKLKNIEDPEYIKQLTGYKNYIEKKTNKKTNIYLYSILKNTIKQIN